MASCADESVYKELYFLILLNENVIKNPSAGLRVKEAAHNLLQNHVKRIAVLAVDYFTNVVEKRIISPEVFKLCSVLFTFLGEDICMNMLLEICQDMSKEDAMFVMQVFRMSKGRMPMKNFQAIFTKIINDPTTYNRKKTAQGSRKLSQTSTSGGAHSESIEMVDPEWRKKFEELDKVTVSSFQSAVKDKDPFGGSVIAVPAQASHLKSASSNRMNRLVNYQEEPLGSLFANVNELFSKNDLILVSEEPPLNADDGDSSETVQSPQPYEELDGIQIDESIMNDRLGLPKEEKETQKCIPIQLRGIEFE